MYTYDEIKQYIESNNEKLLSDTYINYSSKLKIQCTKGHEYEMSLDNHKHGHRCPICTRIKQSLGYENVKTYIQDNGYELYSTEYKNSYSPIKIKCNKNHVYDTTLNRFKQGKRCPICNELSRLQKIEDAKIYLNSFGYTVIGDFTKIGNKITVECPNKHISDIKFGDFKNGHRCKYCSNSNIKYTYQEVDDYISSLGYNLLSDTYKNNKTPLHIKCDKGHEFNTRLDVLKRGIRCPVCNQTSGESIIMKLLEDNNINFSFQYTFKDCIDKKCLPFDFYISSLNTCIEFDGEQHFRQIEWFGGKRAFELCKKHDKIKNNYCKDNSINLIRIPFTDIKNIENILKREKIIE